MEQAAQEEIVSSPPPHLPKLKIEPLPPHNPQSVCNSPASSAFVSALQSPYISPRLTTPPPPPSSSDDNIPSSSYTPPSDAFECCSLGGGATQARMSFSFPVVPPRVSFKSGGVSSPSPAPRSRDVYIGYHGQDPSLVRFCKWVRSELEAQGVACFVADRARYLDAQRHEVADRVICSASHGVVVVTDASFVNPFSLEEIRFFSHKRNLLPVFYDTGPVSPAGSSTSSDCREAIEGLVRSHEFKLEANHGNWRSCVNRIVGILRSKLGRKSVGVSAKELLKLPEREEELPFPRNGAFVGREKEIAELEAALFGRRPEEEDSARSSSTSDSCRRRGEKGSNKFINLELGGKCKEPKMESWTKHVKCSSRGGSSVVCVSGVGGSGKTELAAEFGYRYAQRYKMVLWIGGEARYLRQNILNLSLRLGLDVSADPEKERGRIRSFEEQELEAFKKVKRELFRDMPYLIIIDNLETEREWWDGKDLHNLIPQTTGGSHVIITTRLSKVMNFDMMQLGPLSQPEAMALMQQGNGSGSGKQRRRIEYSREEMEFLMRFDEELGRLCYGLRVVGCLLYELALSPSALFEAVNQVSLADATWADYPDLAMADELFCKNNPFLTKLLTFCFLVLQQANGTKNVVALGMLLVGAWFAPAPVSAALLSAASKDLAVHENRFRKWANFAFGGCCSSCGLAEEDSAMLLVKLGLARCSSKQGGVGSWIQFHPVTQAVVRRKGGMSAARAAVIGVGRSSSSIGMNSDHLWASAFLVFGFKSEPPVVQLKATEMVWYIKKTAQPLAVKAFTCYSRCKSGLELLKVSTNVLEQVEKSFVSQVEDWCSNGSLSSLCWNKRKKKKKGLEGEKVDEYVWKDVTMLKATLMETRAKLLLRGGDLDRGEELCRTCISIRTVMLGHNHAATLAAQETLAKLVKMRTNI